MNIVDFISSNPMLKQKLFASVISGPPARPGAASPTLGYNNQKPQPPIYTNPVLNPDLGLESQSQGQGAGVIQPSPLVPVPIVAGQNDQAKLKKPAMFPTAGPASILSMLGGR